MIDNCREPSSSAHFGFGEDPYSGTTLGDPHALRITQFDGNGGARRAVRRNEIRRDG